MSELDEVCGSLGIVYKLWKDTEKDKNHVRDEFFQLADKAIEQEQGLAVRLVTYAAESLEKASERARMHNPGWQIEEARPHVSQKGVFEVVIKENPSFKPFSYTFDRTKYARQVSRGAVMLDDEWLQEADPLLYNLSTFALPWGTRVAIPIQELEPEVIAKLQQYMYNDNPRISLRLREVNDDTE